MTQVKQFDSSWVNFQPFYLWDGQVCHGVWDPGCVVLLDVVHVERAVDQVVLDDAVHEIVERLAVKIVGEERRHRRRADGDEGVRQVEPDVEIILVNRLGD